MVKAIDSISSNYNETTNDFPKKVPPRLIKTIDNERSLWNSIKQRRIPRMIIKVSKRTSNEITRKVQIIANRSPTFTIERKIEHGEFFSNHL